MEKPVVSVIIPVYNAEEYVERCVASVVNQSIKGIEILLIDDGSTDNSLEICRKWAAQDKRIKVFRQENAGVSSARNRGIMLSTGKYVMLLDSDDWWEQSMCETMLKTLEEEKADCVVCGCLQTTGNVWIPPRNTTYGSHEAFQKDIVYWLNTELLGPSWNKIYIKERITELFPSQMSYGEDLTFCLHYLKGCQRISFIPKPLYRHNVGNASSLTHTFKPQKFDDIERFQAVVMDFANDTARKDPQIYQKYIRDCIHQIRTWYMQSGTPIVSAQKGIKQWFAGSYMKTLSPSHYQLSRGDWMIFLCLKWCLYSCIGFIVKTGLWLKNIK